MKNLKRILSLALASVMVMGMMVVGASAAFKDEDKMNALNIDAINTMHALGVINGKGNDLFDPEGDVTRAEMATMIAVSLHGGDANYRGTTTTGFTDVDGHADLTWAAKHVKYCVDQGIIKGVGGNKFNPNTNVTAQEAATMILTAMGYRAEMLKSNTSDWAAVINQKAEINGLYNDTAVTDYTQPIDRQNAAQMLYNGITTATPMISDTFSVITGEHTYTVQQEGPTSSGAPILTSAFKAKMQYAILTSTGYDDEKEIYRYNLTGTGDVAPFTVSAGNGTTPAVTTGWLESKTDYTHLFRQKVKVIYSGTASNAAASVIGITVAGDCVVSEGNLGLLNNLTAGKLDGIGTNLANQNSTPVYVFNAAASAGTVGSYSGQPYEQYALIDNNSDGKIDCAVVYPVTVGQITFANKDGITVNNSIPFKFKTADVYDGAAVNDYVKITTAANTVEGVAKVEKLETVTGTITQEKKTNKVLLNGTWYTDATATYEVGDEIIAAILGSYIVAGEDVNVAIDLSTVCYVADVDKDAYNKILQPSLAGNYSGVDTMIYFADGTHQIVKAMRTDVVKATDGLAASGDPAKAGASAGLYTYKVNKNGVYELKAVKNTTTAAAVETDYSFLIGAHVPDGLTLPADATDTETTLGAAGLVDEGKLGTSFIADNAVIFVAKTSNGAKPTGHTNVATDIQVISGKELKSMKQFGAVATMLQKQVKGLDTVQMALIYTKFDIAPADQGTDYGYITAGGVGELVNNEYVIHFTVWTEDGEQELTAIAADNDGTALTNASLANFTVGKLVSFDQSAKDGEVVNVQPFGGTVAAVTGYDGGLNIAFDDAAATTLDKDHLKVIYLDTANRKGVEPDGLSIVLANEVSTGHYTKNVCYKDTDSDGDVDVVFVDINNSMPGAAYEMVFDATADGAVPETAVKGLTVTAYTVAQDTSTTSTPNWEAVTTGDDIDAGAKLQVTVTGSGTAAGAATDTVKIVVTANKADGTTIVKNISLKGGDAYPTANTVTFSMPSCDIISIVVTIE